MSEPAPLLPERLVVLDLETTGLDPQVDAIIEIAAVRLEHGRPVAEFHTLVSTDVPMNPGAQAVHGIDPAELLHAPAQASALAALRAFVGDAPWAAHNAPFDGAFLAVGRARHAPELPAWPEPPLDTMEWAREAFPLERSLKLETLCRLCGLPAAGGFHRALADAQYLASAIPVLAQRVAERRAWLRGQYDRIHALAARHAWCQDLIEALQAELAEARRVLQRYFEDHPGASLPLADGRLSLAVRPAFEYDEARARAALAEWGLEERFLKLDRQRLERWLQAGRFDAEQRARLEEARLPAGQTARLVKTPYLDDPAAER